MTDNRPHPSASFRCPSPTFKLNPPPRQGLTKRLAANLLKPLFDTPFQSIIFSDSAFGDGASLVASTALLTLSRKQCLHTIILSNIISALPEEEALRSLSSIAGAIGTHYKKLRAVDLSHNPIGTLGIAHCAPLLDGQTLLGVVNLENTNLSGDAARLLCQWLATPTPTKLVGLNVQTNPLQSGGLHHIASVIDKSPKLECLSVASVAADADAVTAIADALRGKVYMRTLDISSNGFDESTATALSNTLSEQIYMARLFLSDLFLWDDAVNAIVDAIVIADAHLIEFKLSRNRLSSEAIPSITKLILDENSALAVLDLSANQIDGSGARLIADAIAQKGPTCPLQKLQLADNNIDDDAFIHLATCLIELESFVKLDVSHTGVHSQVAQRVSTVFEPMVIVCEDSGLNDSEGSNTDAVDPRDDTFGSGDEIGNELLGREGEGYTPNTSNIRMDASVELALLELERLASSLEAERQGVDGASPQSASTPASSSAASRMVGLFSKEGEASNVSGAPSSETKLEDASSGTSQTRRNDVTSDRIEDDDDNDLPSRLPLDADYDRATDLDNERSVSRTPPPTRTMRGMTSPVTPPELKRISEADVDSRLSDEDEDNASNLSNENVMLSARKLKESIVSLNKEISDVAGELQMPTVSTPLEQHSADTISVAEVNGEVSNYLLVGQENESQKAGILATLLFDCIGGCLVAIFVVVLVLAIAQSQEASTFSYRQL